MERQPIKTKPSRRGVKHVGIIYTTFSDMVIEREGMEFWNTVLEKVIP